MGTRSGPRTSLALALGAAAAATACLMALSPAVRAAPAPSAAVTTAGGGAAPGATGGQLGGSGAVPLPAIPAGMQLVAEDGTLRLAANMTTGDFQVVDMRNGAVWNSSVPNPQRYATNQYWQDTLKSQFDMGYTTTERTNQIAANNQFNSTQAQAKLTATKIPNGMALEYRFPAPYYLSFQATLVLQGSKLIATVPQSGIFESTAGTPDTANEKPLPITVSGTPSAAKQGACPRFPPPPKTMALQLFYFPPECYELSSINFLPAFGAGVPGQGGYIVVPDGSGARIDFLANHPIYTLDYNMPVYGDPTVTPNADQWLPEANMPVFGIVHTDAQDPAKSSAMLGVITKGASNANIVVVPAGQQANLYLASVNFTYRPLYDALGIGLSRSQKYSWKPILGDRQVTYYFLNGSSANYSGLALRFRQYLIDHQHAKPLAPHSVPPLLLHVLNGVREVGVQFDPFMKATTFAQTQQMAQSLEQAGIKSIRLTLEGWMLNGWNWTSLPHIWPPDGRLGGVGGLRRLATWSRGNHVQLVLATGLYEGFQSYGGFNVRTDSLHLESQLVLQDVNKAYLISPDVAANVLYPALLRQMQSVGVTGTDFDYLARDVYPNYQPQHTLTRQQAAQAWMRMVTVARTKLGTAGVQGGNTYAVGAASYFYNAPTTDSGFDYETSAIPFWEIAVHGLALYSGQESNLFSTPTLDNLQLIEDGALPAWELTWQPASVVRYTNYNMLYSSQFSQWAPQMEQQYKQEVQSGYARLAYVAITGNHNIVPGVNVTDYADGSRVIVNFNSKAVTLAARYGGRVVPAQNYIVIPGGGQ